MTYFWKYKVELTDWDDSTHETVQGLVVGKTMAKAVKKLEDYYNPDLDAILFLECFNEDNILEENEIKVFLKETKNEV